MPTFLIENEKWWNRRLKRNKTGKAGYPFIRRGGVRPKETQIIFFYVTQPVKQIKGFSQFLKRINGISEVLLNLYSPETGLESKGECDSFIEGGDPVAFIAFKNIEKFETLIGVDVAYAAKDVEKMPKHHLGQETLDSMI